MGKSEYASKMAVYARDRSVAAVSQLRTSVGSSVDIDGEIKTKEEDKRGERRGREYDVNAKKDGQARRVGREARKRGKLMVVVMVVVVVVAVMVAMVVVMVASSLGRSGRWLKNEVIW